MEQSSTDSNISLDSLENNSRRKPNRKHRNTNANVDTILVPFYENDVLIKVPKDQKRNVNNTSKKENNQCKSYLVNKDRQKSKRPTYLDKFRQQFAPNNVEKKPDKIEIRSLSPEFGDTERESIGDDVNISGAGFYNTESYNEIYYEQLLNRDFQAYLDNSLEEDLQLTDNINLESPNNIRDESPDNFRSVSEVSNPRRQARRATIEPITSVKLGGLGPDMESLKPRLDRARSLQRYSEKVRMENRQKIYKNATQIDNNKKIQKDFSVKQQSSSKDSKGGADDVNATYLVNKTENDKVMNPKSVYFKSKSADPQKAKQKTWEKGQRQNPRSAAQTRNENNQANMKMEEAGKKRVKANTRAKSSSRNKSINTEDGEVPPVHISFMVNVGRARPSSALKTLEQKHRMYQEQVKAFMDNNNG